jgi:hypothetical protein
MDELFKSDVPADLQIDPNKDYSADLIGDGRKYKDVPAAAKAIVYKDAHIAKIEAENAAAKAELEALRRDREALPSLQSLIDKLSAERNEAVPPQGNPPARQEATTPTTIPSTVDVETLVEQTLERRTATQQAQSNQRVVAEVLEKNFGPGWAAVAAQKAKELGVGPQTLEELAKKQPKAVFKLLDVSENPQRQLNPVAGIRSAPSNDAGRKNFDYYEKIRKADPARFNTWRMHQEMIKELSEQGDDFYR